MSFWSAKKIVKALAEDKTLSQAQKEQLANMLVRPIRTNNKRKPVEEEQDMIDPNKPVPNIFEIEAEQSNEEQKTGTRKRVYRKTGKNNVKINKKTVKKDSSEESAEESTEEQK